MIYNQMIPFPNSYRISSGKASNVTGAAMKNAPICLTRGTVGLLEFPSYQFREVRLKEVYYNSKRTYIVIIVFIYAWTIVECQ